MCYLQEMSGVEAGVDRIVDQIVNPDAMEKEVESVIYRLVNSHSFCNFPSFVSQHSTFEGTLERQRKLKRRRSRRQWPAMVAYSWRKRRTKMRASQLQLMGRWAVLSSLSKNSKAMSTGRRA